MPITEVDGAPLAYDEDGQDTGRVPAALAERHRVIRYDLRGYGESTPPLPSFAHHDDLVALLDALGVDRAALVGCSFGGAVAVDAALAYPDRVAALVLLGAVVSGYRWAELEELWDRVVGEVDEDDLDVLAAAEVRFWVVGPDRLPADVDAGLVAFAEEMNRRALAGEAALNQVDVREPVPRTCCRWNGRSRSRRR